jgi:hypothetical protein
VHSDVGGRVVTGEGDAAACHLLVGALGKDAGCKRREKTEIEDALSGGGRGRRGGVEAVPAATPMAVGGAHPGRQGEMEG